jgi:prophage antirepressor-like protein
MFKKARSKQPIAAVQTLLFGDYKIRVMKIGGSVWYILKDICNVLGLTDSQTVVEATLRKQDIGQVFIWIDNAVEEVYVINNAGLNSLIQQSPTQNNKKFQRWIVVETIHALKNLIGDTVWVSPNVDINTFMFNGCILRVIRKDGDTLWVLKDICNVFDIQDINAIAFCADREDRQTITIGDNIDIDVVNEPGLYAIIFRFSTRAYKNIMKKFKKFVVHEMMPTLRKYQIDAAVFSFITKT